jgi:glycosyltransferase involved in cell wall biosynthesis
MRTERHRPLLDGATAGGSRFNILHVLRAPVGGLFRHVVDLARGQAARGHRVGVIIDETTGGARAEAVLADLAPVLALGVARLPMSRQIGRCDVAAVVRVGRLAAALRADVLHGHGAKGGAYARLARGTSAIRAYTPHGGSLHYRWNSPAGLLYLALERLMLPGTDLILFESAYGRGVFEAKLGNPGQRGRVVHNGVTAAEFEPIVLDPQASDLVFVGELRALKGVDILIAAIASLKRNGRIVTATIVGDGPDRMAFQAAARAQAVASEVKFVGAKPARAAFPLGKLLVVPSRAESLPYVVLEAAAGGLPIIAARVGGIAEILGPDFPGLVPPEDAAALARAIDLALAQLADRRAAATALAARVQEGFSTDTMTDAVLAAYHDALQRTAWLTSRRLFCNSLRLF